MYSLFRKVSEKNAMEWHMKTRHDENAPLLACTQCNKSFQKASVLNLHKLTHQKQERLCPYCNNTHPIANFARRIKKCRDLQNPLADQERSPQAEVSPIAGSSKLNNQKRSKVKSNMDQANAVEHIDSDESESNGDERQTSTPNQKRCKKRKRSLKSTNHNEKNKTVKLSSPVLVESERRELPKRQTKVKKVKPIEWPLYIKDAELIEKVKEQIWQNSTKIENKLMEETLGAGHMGLFTTERIEKGQAIVQYAEKLLTAREASLKAKKQKEDTTYQLYFKGSRNKQMWYKSLACIYKNQDFVQYSIICSIDGTETKSEGNLINHCRCGRRRNLKLHIIITSDTDYELVFMSTRDIPAKTEIRYDYGDFKSQKVDTFMKRTNCCIDLR